MEHVYEAGYTDHAGYPVVVVAADDAGALYTAARDTYEPEFSFDTKTVRQSVMLAKVAAWITDHEGHSGWVRQAPFTLHMHNTKTKQRTPKPASTLEDMVVDIINDSPLREAYWKQCLDDGPVGDLRHHIVVGSAETALRFSVPGVCSSARSYEPLTVEDVVVFARHAYEGTPYAVRNIGMSAVAELEYTSRMIRRYEDVRYRVLGSALAAGMTQRAVADVCGVSQSTVSRWLKSDDAQDSEWSLLET